MLQIGKDLTELWSWICGPVFLAHDYRIIVWRFVLFMTHTRMLDQINTFKEILDLWLKLFPAFLQHFDKQTIYIPFCIVFLRILTFFLLGLSLSV